MDDFDAPDSDTDSQAELDQEIADLPEPAELTPGRHTGVAPARAGRQPKAPALPKLPDADSIKAQVYAQTAAQQVMFQRVDQLAKLLEQEYAQSQALRQETMDTMRLWQESFQSVDALADKLARIAAALIKLYQLDLEQQDQGIF